MPAHRGRPGGCKVCGHVGRVEMEVQLAAGATQQAVASKFGVSYHSLHRHWHGHVSAERRAALQGAAPSQAMTARAYDENERVLDGLRFVRGGLYRSFGVAMESGDRRSVAQLAGKLHENLSISGHITKELVQGSLVTINQTNVTAVLDSPQYKALQARMIAVLRRHPAALSDVVAEFEQLERSAEQAPLLPALEHARAAR
jgi:hypothetical protein